MGTLFDRLRRNGYDRVLFVTAAGQPVDPEAVTVDDNGLGYYSLTFTSLPL
jgi:hypothetical protein